MEASLDVNAVKGYVDAAEYPWIKWYPVCDYYSPSSASLT